MNPRALLIAAAVCGAEGWAPRAPTARRPWALASSAPSADAPSSPADLAGMRSALLEAGPSGAEASRCATSYAGALRAAKADLRAAIASGETGESCARCVAASKPVATPFLRISLRPLTNPPFPHEMPCACVCVYLFATRACGSYLITGNPLPLPAQSPDLLIGTWQALGLEPLLPSAALPAIPEPTVSRAGGAALDGAARAFNSTITFTRAPEQQRRLQFALRCRERAPDGRDIELRGAADAPKVAVLNLTPEEAEREADWLHSAFVIYYLDQDLMVCSHLPGAEAAHVAPDAVPEPPAGATLSVLEKRR